MRSSGILMHISSLPSPYGIGTFGKAAYEFADFLKAANQKYWQILPLCTTSFGDSPYQSFSTNAGNPYFIDLDRLVEEGLLTAADCAGNWGSKPETVDYSLIYARRFTVLRRAFAAFGQSAPGFVSFKAKNAPWLNDYALFMALKDNFGGSAWSEWPRDIRFREPAAIVKYTSLLSENIEFYKFLQYEFFMQWQRLKIYVNGLGIGFIGDTPIYVAYDSADVWVNTGLFDLDGELRPRHVAGVPPDGFTADGQLWGNPVYDWKAMKKTGYRWWIERLRFASELYDVVRIDHFRGFDSYFEIEAGATTTKNGVWRDGPGYDLFRAVKKELGELPIIAEDLGYLTDSVRKMLADCGFPGMKVVEFGFYGNDNKSAYLPQNFEKNCVVYAGTHDNEPIIPWFNSLSKEDKKYCLAYLGADSSRDIAYKIIRLMQRSVADTCIVQMQDWLRLGASARMNEPSTIGGNWAWRAQRRQFTRNLCRDIAYITHIYNRD